MTLRRHWVGLEKETNPPPTIEEPQNPQNVLVHSTEEGTGVQRRAPTSASALD